MRRLKSRVANDEVSQHLLFAATLLLRRFKNNEVLFVYT